MTKAVGFTQASVARAIKSIRKAGLYVAGVTADGTVLVSDVPLDPSRFKATSGAASAWEDTEA